MICQKKKEDKEVYVPFYDTWDGGVLLGCESFSSS